MFTDIDVPETQLIREYDFPDIFVVALGGSGMGAKSVRKYSEMHGQSLQLLLDSLSNSLAKRQHPCIAIHLPR
jgi:hypothetical protein